MKPLVGQDTLRRLSTRKLYEQLGDVTHLQASEASVCWTSGLHQPIRQLLSGRDFRCLMACMRPRHGAKMPASFGEFKLTAAAVHLASICFSWFAARPHSSHWTSAAGGASSAARRAGEPPRSLLRLATSAAAALVTMQTLRCTMSGLSGQHVQPDASVGLIRRTD